MHYVLSGDIGGTKTLLQISSPDTGCALLQKTFSSRQFSGLEDMLQVLLKEAQLPAVTAACFALAGPVLGRQVKLTNLPWAVDADAIAARFNIGRVALINDFEAVARGIAALRPSDLLTLQPGEGVAQATRLVAGAGTGLGVAWMSWHDGRYQVHPSEAGHMDFAPSSETEYALWRALQAQHGHVSCERVISGPGLAAIHEFLCNSGRYAVSDEMRAALRGDDAAAVIARYAEAGEPAARDAMDLFLSAYGAFVGNMALATLPRGGIYIAGGMAAKNTGRMQHGAFLPSFLNKGRYSALLGALPVHVVTNMQVGLLGAEGMARQLADKSE